MNIENMEQEFPKMPQSMRDMIEKEVEKQVKVTPQRGYFSLKKAVVASLAATFVLGTTIFAGTKLYRMSSSPQGNYGMTTKIEKTDATENTEKIDPAPQLAMKLSYLPASSTSKLLFTRKSRTSLRILLSSSTTSTFSLSIHPHPPILR